VSALAATSASTPVKLSYKAQRELDLLPKQIEALEAEQVTLREKLSDGKLYQTDPALAIKLNAREAEIEDALMNALERWETLSAGVVAG
jgi:ATP-binding cassette subfamily F protein uup